MCNRGTPGPGPARYKLPPVVGYPDHAPNKNRSPQYSIRPRFPAITKPVGGGMYNIEGMTKYGKVNPPAYSMSSRHPQKSGFQSPGPDRYSVDPNVVGHRAPIYSIRGRHEAKDTNNNPGPKYNVPSTLSPKAYSISARRPTTEKERSPGPARYAPVNADLYKHSHPKYTMSARSDGVKSKDRSPGPAAYGGYDPKGPNGYSFGHKTCTTPYITAADEMPCIEH